MTDRIEILCINKAERMNPHERITHIGGKNPNGTRWQLTQEDAISGIESKRWAFYVNKAGKSVDVIVSVSASRNKYIKTVADGIQPDNLLSLVECPI